MTKILLILHVLAAVIAVGPVTVAGSMFPAAARGASEAAGGTEPLAAVRLLHRICRVYAAVGLAVPVFGFATAGSMHVLGTPWVIVSIVLTAVAALVLALLILPAQETVLTGLTGAVPAAAGRPEPARIRRLAMLTGTFNLLWATVTVLMIVRPGSSTGV